MQTSGRKTFEAVASRCLISVVVTAALVLLQSCGGSTNFAPSTVTNPAPGVTLQKIQIIPGSPIILLAEARQLFATGIYSDGSSVDISSKVAWSASSAPSSTNFVNVNSSGMATASSVGATVISATVGSVVGLLQLTVTTNGFSSSNVAILQVVPKTTEIDVAYLAQQTQIQGNYAVQEVNLDADLFSSVIPVPVALMASIPMPSGFVPNVTIANQSTSQVAVISYSSPNVVIIDGSNNPLDLSSNTIVASYTAPVTQTSTFDGITCMICAGVVNPLNNQLILSTAQGYYSLDMTAGKFTALPFVPAPAVTPSFSLNPAVANPYILSLDAAAGAMQMIDLTSNAVTTTSNVSPAPNAAAIDLTTGYAAIVDGSTNDQTLVNLSDPQSPQLQALSNVGNCSGGPAFQNMVAMGISANTLNHTLFTSQTGGNCVGLAAWPNSSVIPLQPSQIYYNYGPMPPTPDGNPFVNGNDPNTIASFTSAVDKKNYGVLVDANQQWIAKINFGTVISLVPIGPGTGNSAPLPAGAPIPSLDFLTGAGGDPIVYLPTPSTDFTVSASNINFGNVAVGTSSPLISVTIANIGTGTLFPQISLTGANPGDFSLLSNCANALFTLSNCAVSVTFTPTATGARSAILNVSSTGLPTQTVPLSGTGS